MASKIDPRVKRTKKMFEEALLNLLEVQEYDKITVREISEQSTLNRATFYLHYYDKDHLLEQLLKGELSILRKGMMLKKTEYSYDSSSPHPILIRLFETISQHTRFYKIIVVQKKDVFFKDELKKIITTLIKNANEFMVKDNVKHDVPVEISTAYVTSAYLGVIIWWLEHETPFSPIYMAAQLTKMSTVGPFVENPYFK